jgi:hypothetical protein
MDKNDPYDNVLHLCAAFAAPMIIGALGQRVCHLFTFESKFDMIKTCKLRLDHAKPSKQLVGRYQQVIGEKDILIYAGDIKFDSEVMIAINCKEDHKIKLFGMSSEIIMNIEYLRKADQQRGACEYVLRNANPKIAQKGCWRCGKEGVKQLTCSHCLLGKYCDKDCQIADWKEHKKWCKSNVLKTDPEPEQPQVVVRRRRKEVTSTSGSN